MLCSDPCLKLTKPDTLGKSPRNMGFKPFSVHFFDAYDVENHWARPRGHVCDPKK